MTQPNLPLAEVIAAQQDTIDELTAAVARHERSITQLHAALIEHGITIDLSPEPDGREE